MPSYSYIAHCPKTGRLEVHPEKRDWSDYDHRAHLVYHTSIIDSLETDTFSVHVDASRVPYAAVAHIRLFLMLARHARAHYKERLRAVTVRNASAPARAIFNALVAAGALPTATAAKIQFV